MSSEKEILKYLSNDKRKSPLKYKGVRTGFLGLPDFKYYKYQTLANKCSDLKKKGYIQEKNGSYFITYKGEEFLNDNKGKFKNFFAVSSNQNKKDLLVMYDISEDMKSQRDWFRRQLKNLGFIMIQRSVWVGPSPLPKEFLEYVKEIKIGDNFKTFKLANGYKTE
jgi:DNA-binding transcriptional regulator PaaX